MQSAINLSKYIILYIFCFLCLSAAINETIYCQAVPIPQTNFPPKHYICYRSDNSLNIDGKLNEPIWQKAPWTDQFTDITGDSTLSPRYNTRVKMLWDDKFLYVAAELEEPDVWATLTQRDTVILNDNDFEIFIDPDGDTQSYYEFEINAFNAVWDLLLTKPYRMGGVAVTAWDIHGLLSGVDIQGTINKPGDKDKGWTIEAAFPWKILMQCAAHKGLPENGEQWRLNFSRVEWEVDTLNGKYTKVKNPSTHRNYFPDNWVWSPQGLVDMHYPEMWGYVQFSKNIAGTNEDSFIEKPEEYAKWVLRQIFYKERAFYSDHGTYTSKLNDLSFTNSTPVENIPGYQWPPVIEAASDYFEISVISSDKKNKICLFSDGKIMEKAL